MGIQMQNLKCESIFH